MINKNKQIKIQIALLIILLFGVGLENIWGQNKIIIKHQDGAYYNDRLPNGMQKTNTHRTTVYIKEGETKTLSLPTIDYAAPHSYSRWYDYDNDGIGDSPFTTSYNYGNGIVKYSTGNNGVTGTVELKALPAFQKKTVAVDVAAYTDWTLEGTNITTEPTLSYRWIFDMVNANVIADKLTAITDAGGYLEDKVVYLPKKDIAGRENPRVTLEYDRNNYYIHMESPKTPGNTFCINNTGSFEEYSEETTSGNFNYRDKYTYNLEFEVTGASNFSNRFLYIDQTVQPAEITVRLKGTITKQKQKKNNNKWYNDGSSSTPVSLYYNVARFKLNYVDVPKNYDELEEQDKNLPDNEKHSPKHLRNNYILINQLNFDYDTKPVTKENNAWLTPLQWDYCSYGFASSWLYLKNKRVMPDGCAPSKNEYGFVKSANVSNISTGTISSVTITNPKDGTQASGNYMYSWYNSGQTVYDCLHYETNGKKDGYFMYIDASSTPGVVAKLPLENKLCSGTKLFVSAGVCSMTRIGTEYAYADLNFIFKGVDSEGNETELNRYTTGDIKLYTGSGNPWSQIFYTFDYETEVEYERYLLQVENNATSTKGGDYAIDDIRVYRSKLAVQASQILLPCGTEESAKIKVQIGYDKLLNTLWTDPNKEEIEIRYQFMDADKKPISGYNYRKGSTTTEEPFYEYGSIWIKTDRDAMEEWVQGTTPEDISEKFDELPTATGDKVFAKIQHIENDPQGQQYYIVFKTPNNEVLKYNKAYHTTIANNNGKFETTVCSLISDPFIIEKPGQITVDGSTVIDEKGICYGAPITIQAVLLDRINHEPIEPCSFDWYFGNRFAEISASLSHYREEDAYPSYEGDTETGLQQPKGPFTQEDYTILEASINANRLYLNRTEMVRRVTKGETILAKPIVASTGKQEDPDFNICNNVIQLDTDSETAMPEIEIGQGEKTQMVRMSREQMQTLTENVNKTLWIPVNSFKNSNGEKIYQIVQSKDNLYEGTQTGIVYLCGTNDPAYKAIDFSEALLPQIARLNTINVGPEKENYLVFSFNEKDDNFPATATGFRMKEGFTYSLMFFYNEERNGDETVEHSVCNGMSTLNICIVPKYLTWTGEKGDNWNNDGNWKRSTKDELYKTDYADYTGEDLTSAQGFVPMHNSLATIANTTTAPWLYELTASGNGSSDISANTNHPATPADSTDYKANAPSAKIEYELETRNGPEATSTEARKHTYAGVLFKGNSCAQIYFKHGAEMRNTQYLTYEKAHVEFELNNNRWYMLSSPLQSVVAGDMYIPTEGGRQVTEAFKDIIYQQGTVNNRFDPAVYQRNWSTDNAENFLPNTGNYNVKKAGDWSGAYNRVDEIYNAGRGFSIRPIYFETAGGTKEIKEGHQTLFRLPKADERYEYYAYGSDDIPDSSQGWNADKDRLAANGRLALTDGQEQINVTLTNNQEGNGELFLAGNPFMATLDMNKFFDRHKSTNPDQAEQLNRKYILLTDKGQCYFTWNETAQAWESSVPGITGGTVAPLQGFFVERTVKGAEVHATYTPDMTIAKPATGNLLRSVQTRSADDGTARLYVTAERDGFQSHVLIAERFSADNAYNEEEDVATFIDSNLKDQPTLYSVAGNTVVSINEVSDCKMIPLGIYSENPDNVTLSFRGAESFGKEITLYDAQTGLHTAINDNRSSFSIAGNTHGRYFICLGEIEEEKDASVLTAYSAEANRITIVASQGDPLKEVSIYNTLGMEVQRLTGLSSTREEATVSGGLYIVRIKSENKGVTVKVAVKDK